MKTIRVLRVVIVAATTLTTASLLQADDSGAKSTFEIGGTFGQLDSNGKADLSGVAAAYSCGIGRLFTLRADYTHLESNDTLAFQRDNLDVDLRFALSFIPIVKPYVGAGLSYGTTESPSYTPDGDWNAAPALSLGCGITIIPGLLDTTPSVRYVSYNNLKTVTYTLDTAVHFTALGVGLRLNFEDNQDEDASVSSGVLYASFSF